MEHLNALSLRWAGDRLEALDQRRLPHESVYIALRDAEAVREAIVSMAIRGAPLIGISAAYGVALEAGALARTPTRDADGTTPDAPALRAQLERTIERLASARPTAVNLAWALGRMRRVLHQWDAETPGRAEDLATRLLLEADTIAYEDRQTNLAIARHALPLIPPGASVIHHCNTGSLATSDYGTALGIIRYAHEQGRQIHAYLDETRPRFQGAALSAFELAHFGVPHTLIVDSASAFLMSRRAIACCLVGCDRVAANGDTANKIGTYALALAARAHNVPFYVACPRSTLDLALADGSRIEIEERSADEVRRVNGQLVCPEGTQAWNPAFDVTPGSLITAFITERGVVRPPFDAGLRAIADVRG